MLKELRAQAVDVRRVAAALAPEKTSYYVKHLEVAKDVVGWRVESTDPFGHLVEWGSVNNEIYAPLHKAVRVVGLRYVAEPKPEP
jgi:hypothetical protein